MDVARSVGGNQVYTSKSTGAPVTVPALQTSADVEAYKKLENIQNALGIPAP